MSNATNGIEPPRDYLSIKKSKKGPLKQVVPSYASLKNAYTLLWDMPGNTGYINVVAVMQKFFDQAISGNWSYNPEHYPDSEVPVSVMAQDSHSSSLAFSNSLTKLSSLEGPSSTLSCHPIGCAGSSTSSVFIS